MCKIYFIDPFYWFQMCQISVEKPIQDELEQRFKLVNNRLTSLKTESEEVGMAKWDQMILYIEVLHYYYTYTVLWGGHFINYMK